MRKTNLSLLCFLLLSVASFGQAADAESMKDMPLIKAKKIYTVQSSDAGNDLQDNRGFGDKEPEVRMMNLMMVEGSGYEGMDMEEMKMSDSKKSESGHKGHSMSGMHSGDMAMAGEKDAAAPNSYQIELVQSSSVAKVGANVYEFEIKDAKTGKTIPGLKPTAQVYMTSMDMGTETPRVKELKPGRYQAKAVFSMQGPWAIKIVTAHGEKIFEFQASK
ncbi:MAG: FixH family protein [Bdellovibrionales bacterium]|nr:FixH family protein [Bdellovibrionales bacterium]